MRPELLSPLEYLPHPRGLFYALTLTRVLWMNQLLHFRCNLSHAGSALLAGGLGLASLVTVEAETPTHVDLLISDDPHEDTELASSQPQRGKPLRGLLDDWWAPAGLR